MGVVSTQEFGKVFISIKSTTGNFIPQAEKERLVQDLSPFTVASITPVIVDPETIFLVLDVSARFNSNLTTLTSTALASKINDTLINFNKNNLQSFNSSFRHSQVTRLIDDTDDAITSNITKVVLAKFFTPTLNEEVGYTLFFNNRIFNPHARHNSDQGGVTASTGFKVSGDTANEHFFDDDGNGNVRRYYVLAGVKNYIDNTAGTVDYALGTISINPINITSVSDVDGSSSTQIRMTAIPDSFDIIPVRNQILEIDLENTSITTSIDTTEVGDVNVASSSQLATSSTTSIASGY